MTAQRKELHVGTIPRRKKPCLYMQAGASVTVLAHFRDEAALQMFLKFQPQFRPIYEASNDDP